MFGTFFCTSLFLFCSLPEQGKGIIIRSKFFDAVLYQEYSVSSKSISYVGIKGRFWHNLTLLLEQFNQTDKQMLCTVGPGAWFLHPEADYKYGYSRELKFLYGAQCAPADQVNSIQPIGAVIYYGKVLDVSAAVYFSEPFFGVRGTQLRNGSYTGPIKSLLFLDKSNWTLETDGNTFCLSVMTRAHICLLEDIQSSFSTKAEKVTISRGCDENAEQYILQSCFGEGYHQLTYDWDMNAESMKEICSSDYDEKDPRKHKFKSIMSIWYHKIYAPKPPFSEGKGDAHTQDRFTSLRSLGGIMAAACVLVPHDFHELAIDAYELISKYGEIWTSGKGTFMTDPDTEAWKRALDFLVTCKTNVSPLDSGCEPDTLQGNQTENEIKTIEDFLRGDSNDYVLEHIWLLLNFGVSYCSYRTNFINNDWAMFSNQFKKELLYPLLRQWRRPGKWTTIYPRVFNGYDLNRIRKGMITCMQAVIKVTPHYDPLARPTHFYDKVYSEQEKDIVGGARGVRQTAIQGELDDIHFPAENEDNTLVEESTTVQPKKRKHKVAKPAGTLNSTEKTKKKHKKGKKKVKKMPENGQPGLLKNTLVNLEKP